MANNTKKHKFEATELTISRFILLKFRSIRRFKQRAKGSNIVSGTVGLERERVVFTIRGIDTSHLTSKHVNVFALHDLKHCRAVRNLCSDVNNDANNVFFSVICFTGLHSNLIILDQAMRVRRHYGEKCYTGSTGMFANSMGLKS